MVANKYDSVTLILKELHWLPVEQRILFKIYLITFKCLNNLAPSYLKELLTLYRPNRTLRSSSDKLRLVTVPYNLKTYGYRSYSVHAPILWNSCLCISDQLIVLILLNLNLKCLYGQQGFYSYGSSILCKKVF